MLGDEYVVLSIKGHYLEVYIPQFAYKWHLTGIYNYNI